MNGTTKTHDIANQKQTPAQRARRKIAREVAAMLDGILRAAGYEPAEQGIEKKVRHARIEAACARLVADALNYLPRCEAELIAPTGEVYAYVSAPDAKAYCAKNPEFTVRPKNYTPPAKKEEWPQPFYKQDFDRIEDAIERAIEKRLDEALERNSFDEARLLAQRLEQRIPKLIASWLKVAGMRPRQEEVEAQEELITGDKSDMGKAVENSAGAETPTGDNLSPDAGFNSFADNAAENDPPEIDLVENLHGSENFDDAQTAAIFYAKDRWNVLPICNFNPETERCTAPWHKPDADGNPCAGKRPLVSGDGKPGDGYTAATRDLYQITRRPAT